MFLLLFFEVPRSSNKEQVFQSSSSKLFLRDLRLQRHQPWKWFLWGTGVSTAVILVPNGRNSVKTFHSRKSETKCFSGLSAKKNAHMRVCVVLFNCYLRFGHKKVFACITYEWVLGKEIIMVNGVEIAAVQPPVRYGIWSYPHPEWITQLYRWLTGESPPENNSRDHVTSSGSGATVIPH